MKPYLLSAIFTLLSLAGCGSGGPDPVVVYTALDEIYSRPILDAFEAQSGIPVQAVYDTEAAKTTGLVTRLINEATRPRCDVFWNNEVAQTILLKEKGVLAAYVPEAAGTIPAPFKDPEGYWTGFAARARVIIYNTDLVETPPTSIYDFINPAYRGKCAVAMPLFGTTATHAAALYALWGEEQAHSFFELLKSNEVAFLSGNAEVRDRVARGDYAFGLTDTDDANGAVEDGLPAQWLLPDQDKLGTLLIPNAVSLIENAPNPDGARQLIDFLLSPAVEQRLAESRSIQFPLNPEVDKQEKMPPIGEIKVMDVSFDAMAGEMETAATQLRELLVQ